jgi:hypothetical protein
MPTLDTKPAQRRPKVTLSGKFIPAFWEDVDGRILTVRRIKKRLAALRKDAHVESVQQEMIAQRAVFLALQCESMERRAAEGVPIEAGVYAQACNSLLGLLRNLGLSSKHAAKRRSLRDIVAEHDKEEAGGS